jgi:hypothetical protein
VTFMSNDDVIAPTPILIPERHEWLSECPICAAVVFGEDPEESLAAWHHHADEKHTSRLHPPSNWSGTVLLDALVDPTTAERRWAIEAVREYFHSGRYTGGRFERLDPADAAAHPNVITATDLVAVSTLGVDVPAGASLTILETHRDTLSTLLAGIPHTLIQEVDYAVLTKDHPAWDLWDVLRGIHGLGPTKTSKILARKRPTLIPVQDRRVLARLQPGSSYWTFLWDWFQQPRHVAGITQLRDEVGGIDDISLLRVLDVTVWRYDADQR